MFTFKPHFSWIAAACGALSSSLLACRPQTPPEQALGSASSQASSAPAIIAGGELLQRTTFKDGATIPWMPLVLAPARAEPVLQGGAYCMRVEEPGKNPWDVQIRHREMTIAKGHTYTVRFLAWASAKVSVRAQISMSGPPYTPYWGQPVELSSTPTRVQGTFKYTAKDDPTAEFAFHLGTPGASGPVTVCFDDIHLSDPEFVAVAKPKEAAPPAIRVNQLGYHPGAAKRATWVMDARASASAEVQSGAPFEIVDGAGNVVHRGTTEPFGKDPTSGLHVQRIDFSALASPGANMRVRVRSGKDSSESDPFSISTRPFQALARDALRYFYYTRSGIALEQPFVEDARWLRAVGHPTDTQVPCAPDAKCSYSLDVSGGWYDAGDYGKYVVNGGLSAWLLNNLFETAQHLKLLAVPGLEDRELNLPESGNQLPDLLDEARWELEWMLKMQVPEGKPQAGLVHHKMHDSDWSALATLPVQHTAAPRQLRPVSTAATLNLVATAAQAARLFRKLDAAFAERCLTVAKRAWAAAEANPNLLIAGDDNRGGGSYEDADVSDERYWAAAELYVTTGDPALLAHFSKSRHHLNTPTSHDGVPGVFNWRTTSVLGTISLALDARYTPAATRAAARKHIVTLADKLLSLSQSDAFAQPFGGTHYPWGSNSFIVNNGLILAYAHAFTRDARYLTGALGALDYVLGRNALGKSYITGYGARPLTHPHHRLWAHSLDAKFPTPPPGVLSGGPNSDLQDPYSKGLHPNCIGQTCFVDHIEAYSANEVAINWNAALAWLTSYVEAVQH